MWDVIRVIIYACLFGLLMAGIIWWSNTHQKGAALKSQSTPRRQTRRGRDAGGGR
jgi:hypothetical protein